MSVSLFGLDGFDTYDVKVLPDERGFFGEVLRRDWSSFLRGEWVDQVNLSVSFPGIVRAWHRHLRGQVDYFLVLHGAMKICAYDDRDNSSSKGVLAEVVASGDKLQLVRVPGDYWHGTKTVGVDRSLTAYFVTRLYDYKAPDEERRPWNDPSITPTSINGNVHDPRVGKPWDWFASPHK